MWWDWISVALKRRIWGFTIESMTGGSSMVSLTATADTPTSDVSPPVPVKVSGVTIIVAIVACVGASAAAAELEEAAPSSTVPSVLSFKTAMLMRSQAGRAVEPRCQGATQSQELLQQSLC